MPTGVFFFCVSDACMAPPLVHPLVIFIGPGSRYAQSVVTSAQRRFGPGWNCALQRKSQHCTGRGLSRIPHSIWCLQCSGKLQQQVRAQQWQRRCFRCRRAEISQRKDVELAACQFYESRRSSRFSCNCKGLLLSSMLYFMLCW